MREFKRDSCSEVNFDFWLAKFEASNDVGRCSLRGSKATSSTTDRRAGSSNCKGNHFASSSMLPAEWAEDISASNRLNAADLLSRKPPQKPKLSHCHASTRLAWVMARWDFRQRQWPRIVFTNKSRFCLFSTDVSKGVETPNKRHSSYVMDTEENVYLFAPRSSETANLSS